MSYVALATNSFDEVAHFYGELLGFPVVGEWDRPRGRGRRFDLGGGLRLEILDNVREPLTLELHKPGGRMHLVIEVDDIDVMKDNAVVTMPTPQTTSWGARICQLKDPDGILVTFLQWAPPL